MKAVIVIVVLVSVYLFMPKYTLYIEEDSISNTYTIQETGFYLEKNCKKKGETLERAYRCVGTSAWSDMVGKNEAYNKTREAD